MPESEDRGNIAGAYKDAAVSGASMILRPGIQALLDDARQGMFEIVVAEALDRVSSDLADAAASAIRGLIERIVLTPSEK